MSADGVGKDDIGDGRPDEPLPIEGEPKVTVFPPTVRQANDPRGGEATWTLMPITNPDVCSQCGRDHTPDEPHDQQSMHYQMAFKAEHNRWPTWEDALAHCPPEIQTEWRKALRSRGVEI